MYAQEGMFFLVDAVILTQKIPNGIRVKHARIQAAAASMNIAFPVACILIRYVFSYLFLYSFLTHYMVIFNQSLDLFQKQVLQTVLGKASETLNVLFASVTDHFELCLAKCRTSSQSVQHENTYRDPKAKHCYGEIPTTGS